MLRRSLATLTFAAASIALTASTAHAAVGDLPRITEGPPANTERFFFDDHSISGDDHLSWTSAGGTPVYVSSIDGAGSQSEPQAIRADRTMLVNGPGGLEVCGYQSGAAGWMRAYQTAPGTVTGAACPATEPTTGQFGWFRYVYGRHSPTGEFNRWHLMDVERTALVPVGGGGNVPVVWDTHWGTCLGTLSGALGCPTNTSVPRLDVGIPTGGSQLTQRVSPAQPDAQVIPIPVSLQPRLPNGTYQVVSLTNPYGLLAENGGAIGSVSCVTVSMTIGPPAGFGEVTITVTDPNPPTCLLPTSLDPALTGPGGADPMAGAESVPACTRPYGIVEESHCWPMPSGPRPPGDIAPHEGAHIAAHSLATGNPAAVSTLSVAQGAPIPEAISATGRRLPAGRAVTPAPGGGGGGGGGGGDTTGGTGTSANRTARTVAVNRTRSALRRVFGTGLSRLRVSCRVRPASAATCTVGWRKSGARYSGKVYLRTARVNGRMRWQYRVDVKRTKGGRTTHVRRGYRTGGTLSS